MPTIILLLLLQTPNTGNVFSPAVARLPSEPHALAVALLRYHDEEKALFAPKVLESRQIQKHWQKLRGLRKRLDRLAARGALARLAPTERSELRKALTGVVEHSVELVYVTVDEIDPRIFDADEERTVELLRMAVLGNRWLGLEVQDVFGIPVEGGVS
jgi:hypothetical protein